MDGDEIALCDRHLSLNTLGHFTHDEIESPWPILLQAYAYEPVEFEKWSFEVRDFGKF